MVIEKNEARAIGLQNFGNMGGLIGIAALAFALFQVFSDPSLLSGYLFAYVFWFGISIGCLGLTLLHHTVRGAWGLSILRLIEAGGSWTNWVLMLVLSAPILMNLPKVYEWATPEFKAHGNPGYTEFKFLWMSENFFIARIIIYCLAFALWAYVLRKSSLKQDETRDESLAQWRTNLSAPSLVFFVILATLAFTDLTMSLDPHWFSHIWGFINIAGSTLAVFAICNLIVMTNANRLPYSEVMNRGLSKDLGNWMFVFTCLWAYFSFSQYVIIYAGNLPEFTSFFLARRDPTWGALGLSLMAGSFLVPFVTLLSPKVKATPRFLVVMAVWILIFRIVDVYWMVIPFFRETLKFQIVDLVSFLGIGGAWWFGFGRQITVGSLLPTHDPRLKEAYEHA